MIHHVSSDGLVSLTMIHHVSKSDGLVSLLMMIHDYITLFLMGWLVSFDHDT